MANASVRRKTSSTVDFYETPHIATYKLLKAHKLVTKLPVLEPCVGHGAIKRVLEKQGLTVVGSDLRTTKKIDGHKGIDAMTFDFNQFGTFDYIVTNTPYCLNYHIVDRLLQYARKELIIFHRLNFLETGERSRWLKTKSHLKKIYVMGDRVSLTENGKRPEHASAVAYCWYVFDKSYKGLPQLDWLFTKRYKIKLKSRKT